MILEHEILEQLLDEAWPLDRVIAFLFQHDGDAWRILHHHIGNGNLVFLDREMSVVSKWRADEILRSHETDSDVSVQCTAKGARIVC